MTGWAGILLMFVVYFVLSNADTINAFLLRLIK